MSDVIDITGLDKAAVLAAMFNASAPQGLGFLQAGNGPQTMSIEDAQSAIDQQGPYFDYLLGRPLKTNLEGDSFDPWGFDRDNGGAGTAQKVIDRLRETSQVSDATSKTQHQALLTTKLEEAKAMLPEEFLQTVGSALSEMTELEEAGIPVPPEGLTQRQYLNWASDRALEYFDKGETSKSLLLFGVLLDKKPDLAWILTHPATPMLMQIGVVGGRAEIETMMKGFAASDDVLV